MVDFINCARDAARWRISQLRAGPHSYFLVRGDNRIEVGIQPHPVTKAMGINHCIMGRGNTEGEAIDGIFASLSAYVAEGATFSDDIETILILFEEGKSA